MNAPSAALVVLFVKPKLMVLNDFTGREETVSKAMIDISGIRCGSDSTLNTRRASNNGPNMARHSTGQDVGLYCDHMDGPVAPDMGFVENVSKSLTKRGGEDDSSDDSETEAKPLSMSDEWHTQLNVRGRNTIGRTQFALRNGGPASRLRHYQMNCRRNAQLGLALSIFYDFMLFP